MTTLSHVLPLLRVPKSLAAPFLYVTMLLATPIAFVAIAQWGSTLSAPVATDAAAELIASAPQAKSPDLLLHFLLAMMVIMAAAMAMGRLFRWLHQPPVIGEVIAGIMLGPSLLGAVLPDTAHYLLPDMVLPHLATVAQLGVILYMFIVGLEFNPNVLRQRGHAAAAISHASIVAPMLLGALLALLLFPILAPGQVSFPVFALFLGVAMSVTAFPVLARILTDQRMQNTELGSLALACAAIDDVTAWCLLALVVGVAQSQVSAAITVVSLAAAFMLFMFLVGRPLLTRLLASPRVGLSREAMVAMVIGLFASAWVTEAIGLHAVIGAFLFGAIIPSESKISHHLRARLEDVVGMVLLPAFFAIAGARTQIGLISGLENWLLCGLIILVAIAGKFGGSAVAARLSGMNWRDSAALGILMNTRGLMELIVLNIGLDLGVISPRMYALMVVMAIVTTLMTSPILRWLGLQPKVATAEPAAAAGLAVGSCT
jgi:Kef-type K+ transport system membrane component KefB